MSVPVPYPKQGSRADPARALVFIGLQTEANGGNVFVCPSTVAENVPEHSRIHHCGLRRSAGSNAVMVLSVPCCTQHTAQQGLSGSWLGLKCKEGLCQWPRWQRPRLQRSFFLTTIPQGAPGLPLTNSSGHLPIPEPGGADKGVGMQTRAAPPEPQWTPRSSAGPKTAPGACGQQPCPSPWKSHCKFSRNVTAPPRPFI